MLNPHFIILGFAINLVGTARYVIDTLRGKTRPNRVSWIMWTLAPMVAFAAQLSEGVGLQALMTFSAGFTPFLILIASFINRKSVWRVTKFDIWCGVSSIGGVILWFVTRHAGVAIFFAIIADLLAAMPTLTKSWKYPETETALAYLVGGINGLIALLTIDHFTFSNTAFALYITLICAVLYSLIQFKIGIKLTAKTT